MSEQTENPIPDGVPFQGTTSERRESFGEYVRLEADPSDPTAGGEPGRIIRANERRDDEE